MKERVREENRERERKRTREWERERERENYLTKILILATHFSHSKKVSCFEKSNIKFLYLKVVWKQYPELKQREIIVLSSEAKKLWKFNRQKCVHFLLLHRQRRQIRRQATIQINRHYRPYPTVPHCPYQIVPKNEFMITTVRQRLKFGSWLP